MRTAEELEAENTVLRKIAARLMPCHYCGVEQIAECPRGWPGCALADDVDAADQLTAATIQALVNKMGAVMPLAHRASMLPVGELPDDSAILLGTTVGECRRIRCAFQGGTISGFERGQQRVVCAALRHQDGRLVVGARHFDSLMKAQIGEEDWGGAEQGFVDQYGRFMTREIALEVARSAGQIVRRVGGDETRLYSENLY